MPNPLNTHIYNIINKMSYVTLAPFVKARPWLANALKPIANWYANAAGYRQLGLRYVCAAPLSPSLNSVNILLLCKYLLPINRPARLPAAAN